MEKENSNNSVKKRCTYITEEQKRSLIDLVSRYPQLQKHKFTSCFTHKDAQKLWEGIGVELHKIPGAIKDWKQWKKTWQDIRSSSKAKSSEIRNYAKGTGGGPALNKTLSEIDKNVLALMNSTTVEGHEEIQESCTVFDWGDNSEFRDVQYLSDNDENELLVDNVDSCITNKASSSTDVKTSASMSTSSTACERLDTHVTGLSTLNSTNKTVKRSTPAELYQQSIKQTEKLTNITEEECEVRKAYYAEKLRLYKKQIALIERDVTAKENISASLSDRLLQVSAVKGFDDI